MPRMLVVIVALVVWASVAVAGSAPAMGASPATGSSLASVAQYGPPPKFCTVVVHISVGLPGLVLLRPRISVTVYVSALVSTLHAGLTVPSSAARAFLHDSLSALLKGIKGPLKPYVKLRRAVTLTGSPSKVRIALAKQLADLGAPVSANGRVHILAGRTVRVDVVQKLTSGAKPAHHTSLLPCKHPSGTVKVTLADFSPPGSGARGASSSGGGLSIWGLGLAIAGGLLAVGFASAGVRRLRRGA